MKAHARLVARWDGTRTVLRELRSMTPLTLVPQRRSGPVAVVHLVGSATAPLGGDELRLTIEVGPGASVRLVGIAATIVLPGPHGLPSSAVVEVSVAEGGSLEHLPEPTVITAGANHTAQLRGDVAGHLRTREILVLGRENERPGCLTTSQHLTRAGRPVLHQTLTIGDPALAASVAVLAGRRVLATELTIGGPAQEAAAGPWWSRTPLAAGGTLTTCLAADAITANEQLGEARITR